MKNHLLTSSLFLILASVIFFSFIHPAQDKAITFKAYGNCGMCKKRIESALMKNAGISSANWSAATKKVKVTYNPKLISVDQIHKIIADSGHDTDKAKAASTVYDALPGCCKYKRSTK